MKNFLYIFFLLVLVGCSNSQNKKVEQINVVDTLRIKNDVAAITQTEKARNYQNIEALNVVAGYIKKELTKVCDSVRFQKYTVEANAYKNVIGSIGIEHSKRIIIGAHYDVAGNQDGADDNASGVAGLLELARLLSKQKLNYRIDFVAYTLEEPPFFRTKQMGSYIHANYLFKNKIPVKGMICLESIGYFNDGSNSQRYPIADLRFKYGTKGDFITVVQNRNSADFSKQIEDGMKRLDLIKTVSFKGSTALPGIDFSDHLNYWKLDYDAVMITNTALYRNENYHKKGDKIETLSFDKMSAVIAQLFIVIKDLK